MEAFINLLKCAFGTGCLAMPKAFYNAGWLLGLISTILLSSLVVYAMHVLVTTSDPCIHIVSFLISPSTAAE